MCLVTINLCRHMRATYGYLHHRSEDQRSSSLTSTHPPYWAWFWYYTTSTHTQREISRPPTRSILRTNYWPPPSAFQVTRPSFRPNSAAEWSISETTLCHILPSLISKNTRFSIVILSKAFERQDQSPRFPLLLSRFSPKCQKKKLRWLSR